MRESVAYHVASLQCRLVVRDRRIRLLVGLTIVFIACALASNAARSYRLHLERSAATAAEEHGWSSQYETNPHNAAHFGRYVFKPISVLSMFDPGLSDHVGLAARLEAHGQNPARQRRSETDTSLTRFSDFSVAFALQVLTPLVIIFTAFTSFSGQQTRTLIGQELACGAYPVSLLIGRLVAMGIGIAAIVGSIAAVGAVALLLIEPSWENIVRLGFLTIFYSVYLLCIAAIVLGVSALCRSRRNALIALLAFWAISLVLIPRIAPTVAEQLYPTPSAQALTQAVMQEVRVGTNEENPLASAFATEKERLIREYDVASETDLPFSMAGLELLVEERLQSGAYDRHFASLYDTYEKQASIQRAFSLISPLMAIKPLSEALAQTDFQTHRHFMEQAERYRYRLIQALNRDIFLHGKELGSSYAPDVTAIDVGRFEYTPLQFKFLWARQAANLGILLAWTAASLLFSVAAVSRLQSAS